MPELPEPELLRIATPRSTPARRAESMILRTKSAVSSRGRHVQCSQHKAAVAHYTLCGDVLLKDYRPTLLLGADQLPER